MTRASEAGVPDSPSSRELAEELASLGERPPTEDALENAAEFAALAEDGLSDGALREIAFWDGLSGPGADEGVGAEGWSRVDARLRAGGDRREPASRGQGSVTRGPWPQLMVGVGVAVAASMLFVCAPPESDPPESMAMSSHELEALAEAARGGLDGLDPRRPHERTLDWSREPLVKPVGGGPG